MGDGPRLVSLRIELWFDPTAEEQAVFDGDDEAAQAATDQAILSAAVSLLEGQELAGSRFDVGTVKASTGNSWINRFSS